MTQQEFEGDPLLPGRKAKELQRPLSGVGVHVESHRLALVWKHLEGRERHVEFVTHAAHIEHHSRGGTLAQLSFQPGNHNRRLTRNEAPRTAREPRVLAAPIPTSFPTWA